MKSEKIIKNAKGITLIALVVTIVVLLILAAISIGMLTGENGIINQAKEAKDSTEISEEKEKVEISSVSAAGKDTWGNITKENLKEELDKNIGEGKYTLDGEGPFTVTYVDSNRSYIVNTDGNVYASLIEDIYDADVSEEDIAPVDIFNYEIISDAETGATSLDSLPTKEARITGINLEYCNLGGYNPDTGIKEYTDTNYEIVLKDGSKITDTLVVPYQVEIDGEMYKITEADISMRWYDEGSRNSGYMKPLVEAIIYPSTIEKIYTNAYSRNSSIKKIILSNNLKELGKNAISGCTSLTSIEIPNSVTNIGDSAFNACTSLTSIEIPDSLTSIGESAFADCESLTSIEIPSSVTSIGNNIFDQCTSLASIKVDDKNSIYNSKNNCNAIIETNTNTLIQGCKNTIIPSSVTSIGDYAFTDCYEGLTSLEIPSSVISIGYHAFFICNSLTTVKYTGTMAQWQQISIEWGNNGLKKLPIICTDGTINP